MEWNGKFYFGWPYPPWRGVVYEVDSSLVGDPSVMLVLPDGTKLQWQKDSEGYFDVVSATKRGAGIRQVKAERVFDTNKEGPTFAGDWRPFIRSINAAAAVNALFSVRVSKEEYNRLLANNRSAFEALKQDLSPRAASLLHLVDWDEEEFRVDLYRTGRCP
jgi:hypothetical protein